MNCSLTASAAFVRAASYRALRLPPARTVQETGPPEDGFPYSERHLQCVWYDAALRPPALSTSRGEAVRVEHPGRWNLESGPDFLDAALAVGPEQRRIRGDIEIHVRPADWEHHGHARDPLYANVIAHVTYFPGSLSAALLPPGAVEITMRRELEANPAFSFEAIDLTAYPHAALAAPPAPCARVLAAWEPARRAALLEAAGEERIRLKTLRLAAAVHERGAEQAFFEEILCALGYKHNRVPFRRLARLLPLATLREEAGCDPLTVYALLLGVAGLIPDRVSRRWDDETRAFVRSVWDRWWTRQSRWQPLALPRGLWKTAGLRPPNHPLRRLAAAASLFSREPSVASELLRLDPRPADGWFRRAQDLLGAAGALPYWKRRLSLSSAPAPAEQALLGAGRIAAMLTNVVIPCLAAQGADVAPLLRRLPAEEDNSRIRQTAFALFGRDHNPALHADGLRQQGLLQIHHDFCLSRTGCRDCRLAAALEGGQGLGSGET